MSGFIPQSLREDDPLNLRNSLGLEKARAAERTLEAARRALGGVVIED